MDKELLSKLGLTSGEIEVYLTLNKLGETTTGQLVQESHVSKSKVYDILERLIKRGLVGYIIKDNVKHFSVSNPQMILSFIEQKELELENTKTKIKTDLLPELLLAHQSIIKKRLAEMYEGDQGVRTIREELLRTTKPNETILVLGAPKIANLKWEGWFLDFHKRRIEHKVKMKILYNHDAKEYAQKRKVMSLTEVRILPHTSPNWIDIFPEAVLFVMLLKKPIAFVVHDKDLAQSFKDYFAVLWKVAKES